MIEFHQFKDALGINATEAKSHPDTLQAFSEIADVVQASPELVTAYTGVLRFRGEKRTSAIEQVKTVELDILTSMNDLGLISDARLQKSTEQLDDITHVKQQAKRFVSLFKNYIPIEQRPKIKRRKKKPKTIDNDTPSDDEKENNDSIQELYNGQTVTTKTTEKAEHAPLTQIDKWNYYAINGSDGEELVMEGTDAMQFILHGDKIACASLDQMQAALRSLAGHDLLAERADIMDRYCKIQQVVAKHVTTQTEKDLGASAMLYLLSLFQDEPEWQTQAACRDKPELNYHPSRGKTIKPQKEVCADCPVQEQCLEYALTNKIKFGIWGGASERQRRRMRKTIVATGASPDQIRRVVVEFCDNPESANPKNYNSSVEEQELSA